MGQAIKKKRHDWRGSQLNCAELGKSTCPEQKWVELAGPGCAGPKAARSSGGEQQAAASLEHKKHQLPAGQSCSELQVSRGEPKTALSAAGTKLPPATLSGNLAGGGSQPPRVLPGWGRKSLPGVRDERAFWFFSLFRLFVVSYQ